MHQPPLLLGAAHWIEAEEDVEIAAKVVDDAEQRQKGERVLDVVPFGDGVRTFVGDIEQQHGQHGDIDRAPFEGVATAVVVEEYVQTMVDYLVALVR